MSRVKMLSTKKKKLVLSLLIIAWAVTIPVVIVFIAFSPPPADLYLKMYPGETSSFTVTAANLSDEPINTTVIVVGLRSSPWVEQVGSIQWALVQPLKRQNFTLSVRLMPPTLDVTTGWVIVYLYGENGSRQLLSPAVLSLSVSKIVVIISLLRSQ